MVFIPFYYQFMQGVYYIINASKHYAKHTIFLVIFETYK